MNEKAIGVIITILLVIGVVSVAVNKIQSGEGVSPSPNPSDALIFNLGQPTPSAQLQPQQPTPAQIKTYRVFPGVLSSTELQDKKAVIQTKYGAIEFEIYPEASKAASNFIFLARSGFYDGLTFHRVEKGFVIQGGDPLGNGHGGPGYQFEDEPITRNYERGVVAMANAGPNTNGSQFFILLADRPDMPKQYTIFGKVIKGLEVVDQIQKDDVMQKVTIEPNSSPGT